MKELIDVANHQALDKTLSLMNSLEKTSLTDIDFNRFLNNHFTNRFINMDSLTFLEFVHNWVYNHIKYVDDEFDETIIGPRHIIKQQFLSGDCDDKSLLIKTILDYYGIKAKYILFSQTWGNFTHIAVTVDINNKTYYLDGVRKDFNILPKYKYYKIIG